jgi:hypothetical protein
MMLPSLNKVRDSANVVIDTSNLRQTGIAIRTAGSVVGAILPSLDELNTRYDAPTAGMGSVPASTGVIEDVTLISTLTAESPIFTLTGFGFNQTLWGDGHVTKTTTEDYIKKFYL